MKVFTRFLFAMMVLGLMSTSTAFAQEASKIVVKQKVAREDGNIEVTKKEIAPNELAKYLGNLKSENGEPVEIHVTTNEAENVRITKQEDGTLLYVREAGERAEGLTKISDDKNNRQNWNWNWNPATATNPASAAANRPILGIYADEHADAEGIVIGSLSTSQGVAAAGLKAGDVITVVDGKTLRSNADLRAALANHQPGDKVMVTYLRDGQPTQAEVMLAGERSYVRASAQRDPCKVFIGVGTSTRNDEGLHVDYIVGNTPAEVSDVRAGDMILALDNVPVSSQSELEAERDKHQPGEAFALSILRAGQPMTVNARFKECTEEDRQKAAEASARRLAEREEWRSYMREARPEREARNPCDVFIGIYTHSVAGGGRQVDGIIKGTPAENSQLQKGDVILALDDVPVNTHGEIIRERNKHEPGDRFTLLVQRNGEYLEVDAQFNACGEQPTETPTQIVETMPEVETPEVIKLLEPNNELKVAEWNAYPNPTFGNINVQFRAEAVSTTFQILDATGKAVYEENLNRFDGYYQKQLNLGGNMPGVYVLVVRQGDKIFYNKVVLLAKA